MNQFFFQKQLLLLHYKCCEKTKDGISLKRFGVAIGLCLRLGLGLELGLWFGVWAGVGVDLGLGQLGLDLDLGALKIWGLKGCQLWLEQGLGMVGEDRCWS